MPQRAGKSSRHAADPSIGWFWWSLTSHRLQNCQPWSGLRWYCRWILLV